MPCKEYCHGQKPGYKGVFVPSLGQNIIGMNNDYQSIVKLFEKNGIEHFSRLPDGQNDIKLFADLFNNISNYYWRSVPQLFTWAKKTYDTEDAGEVEGRNNRYSRPHRKAW